jgi:hypothetical protein
MQALKVILMWDKCFFKVGPVNRDGGSSGGTVIITYGVVRIKTSANVNFPSQRMQITYSERTKQSDQHACMFFFARGDRNTLVWVWRHARMHTANTTLVY